MSTGSYLSFYKSDFARCKTKTGCLWEQRKPICRYLHKIFLTFCRAHHANVQECQLNLHAHTQGEQIISCTLTLKSSQSKQNGGWSHSQPDFKQRQKTVPVILGQRGSSVVADNITMKKGGLTLIRTRILPEALWEM